MNSVLFMDQIEDLYLLSGKEGVVIYFLMEGSYVTQYLMLIMLVIKASLKCNIKKVGLFEFNYPISRSIDD